MHRHLSLLAATAFAIVLSLPAAKAGAGVRTVVPASFAARPAAKSAQFLYVYNLGSPGVYTAEFARYHLPDLTLLETTAADGVASPEAFDKTGLGYFVDEAPQGHYGLYQQPIAANVVPAVEEFSGIPCNSTSLATGPTSNFYVVQYCSANVLEFKPGAVKGGGPKSPIATYTGGNLQGSVLPTYAAVDHKGNLYVGDNEGGITLFPAGKTTPVIAYPAGNSQPVTQIVVDAQDDVWSVHLADPKSYYFSSETSCIVQTSGPVIRNEVAERFSKGKLVGKLYSAPTDSSYYAAEGVSIAVDAAQRVYVGVFEVGGASAPSVVLDYPATAQCPDLATSLLMVHGASPTVTVDAMKRYYVTDYVDNMIFAYKGGSLKLLAKITQATGVINISSSAISP